MTPRAAKTIPIVESTFTSSLEFPYGSEKTKRQDRKICFKINHFFFAPGITVIFKLFRKKIESFVTIISNALEMDN